MKRTPLKRKTPLRPRNRNQIPWEIRQQVRNRSVMICEYCKSALGTQLHHKLPRGRGGKHTLENLILLCSVCHDWTTRNPSAAKNEGLTI